jgi:cytochrome c oxidase subunit 3
MAHPVQEQVLPKGTSALGLAALIASLSVLFAGTLAGFWIIRAQAEGWADGLPGLPVLCLLSTAILVCLSWFAQGAVTHSVDSPLAAAKKLRITLALGVLFLVSQGFAWEEWMAAGLPPTAPKMYGFLFYFLTALHGLHVVGGLVYSVIVLQKTKLGTATEEQTQNQAWYWHFLGVVWIVLYATFYVGSFSSLNASNISTGFLAMAAVSCGVCTVFWVIALTRIVQARKAFQFLVGLFMPMAFAFACVHAEKYRMKRFIIPWFLAFAVFLFCVSIGMAVLGITQTRFL